MDNFPLTNIFRWWLKKNIKSFVGCHFARQISTVFSMNILVSGLFQPSRCAYDFFRHQKTGETSTELELDRPGNSEAWISCSRSLCKMYSPVKKRPVWRDIFIVSKIDKDFIYIYIHNIHMCTSRICIYVCIARFCWPLSLVSTRRLE